MANAKNSVSGPLDFDIFLVVEGGGMHSAFSTPTILSSL